MYMNGSPKVKKKVSWKTTRCRNLWWGVQVTILAGLYGAGFTVRTVSLAVYRPNQM